MQASPNRYTPIVMPGPPGLAMGQPGGRLHVPGIHACPF
jgi:hypothetical protein